MTDKTHENISTGDTVTLEKGSAAYDAQITEIGSMINAATGLYDVKAVLSEEADLTTGSKVKLSVIREQALNTMIIPLTAVN